MRLQSYFLLFALFCCLQVEAQTLSVPIYIFELRPLVYRDEKNNIKGPWFESFQELSKKSNVEFVYQFVSIPRMELLLSGNKPGCNLTLLKTKSRADKINFIHSHGIKSVIKAYQRSNDPRVWTLKKIQKDKNLKIATNTSVGVEVLANRKISAELLFNINSIVQMLTIKRIDLFVGSNLAVETMDEFKTGKIKVSLPIKTLTHGIGCSYGTSLAIIDQVKKGTKGWTLRDPSTH